MASGLAAQRRVAAALRRLQATPKIVRFRTVESAGGNTRLGLGQVQVAVDTDVSPQPAVEQVTAEELATSGGLYQPGDYRLTFDGSLPERTFRDGFITFGDDVLQAKEVTPAVLNGVVVAWTVIARSVDAGD